MDAMGGERADRKSRLRFCFPNLPGKWTVLIKRRATRDHTVRKRILVKLDRF